MMLTEEVEVNTFAHSTQIPLAFQLVNKHGHIKVLRLFLDHGVIINVD
jgi:hypothetical protein